MTPEARAVFDEKMAKLKEKQKKKHALFTFTKDARKNEQPTGPSTPSSSEEATPAETASPAEAQTSATPSELDSAINEFVDEKATEKTKKGASSSVRTRQT